MEIIKSPQDNIEAYLYNEINNEIYIYLVDTKYNDTDILSFFNLLYHHFNFFNDNCNNYKLIKNHFTDYFFDNQFTNEICFNILHDIHKMFIKLIDFYYNKDNSIMVLKSCESVKTIFDRLNPKEEIKIRYQFDFTLKYLKQLPTTINKIKYLWEVKTDYLHHYAHKLNNVNEITFDKKCELEINKLEKILTLEQSQTTINNQQIIETKTEQINPLNWNGTQTEFIELIKALIENGNIKGTQTEIISNLSNVFNIEIKHPNKLITDIKIRNNGSETLFLDKLQKSLFDYITLEKKK